MSVSTSAGRRAAVTTARSRACVAAPAWSERIVSTGRLPVLLGDGEDLERPRPVPLVVADGHRVDAGARCHLETRVTPSPRMRPHERPGGAHLRVEARGARRAGAVAGLGVEHDDDLVPRRVLELLDHQLVSARGGGPVHAAERLAALVLAHAVELEAGRAAEQDSSGPVRPKAALAEEDVEAGQARIDDQRRGVAERLDPLRKAERILDDGAGPGESVSAAGDTARGGTRRGGTVRPGRPRPPGLPASPTGSCSSTVAGTMPPSGSSSTLTTTSSPSSGRSRSSCRWRLSGRATAFVQISAAPTASRRPIAGA